MTAIQPGALVNVTIKGVRYTGENEHGHAIIANEDNDQFPLPAHATFERVTPAEWPPQPGDLWRDNGGQLWFTVEDHGVVSLTCNGRNKRPTEDICDLYSPLTLVYREYKPCGCDHHGDHAGCDADCECAQ